MITTSAEFNKKYSNYLKPRFYGLDIDNPMVIQYLDSEFEKEIKQNHTFQYSQIKLKFGRTVIYCSKEPDVVREWEEKIDGILLMSKELILTQKELEQEIRQAFIHGQRNYEMMEHGLERDETEDYVNSRMVTILNQNKDE